LDSIGFWVSAILGDLFVGGERRRGIRGGDPVASIISENHRKPTLDQWRCDQEINESLVKDGQANEHL